jgi:hypothetical protein
MSLYVETLRSVHIVFQWALLHEHFINRNPLQEGVGKGVFPSSGPCFMNTLLFSHMVR